jgi:DNA-directed RNA polymerase subunit RPC12/RpoP
MATRADITCKNCDNTFQVFWHEFTKQLPLSCPYCSKEIDETMTEMLKRALGTTWEVNYHFRKYHEERNEPLFVVNISDVYVPIEKFDLDD